METTKHSSGLAAIRRSIRRYALIIQSIKKKLKEMDTHEFYILDEELQRTDGVLFLRGNLVFARGIWCAISNGAQDKIKALIEREFWLSKDLSEAGSARGSDEDVFPTSVIRKQCILTTPKGAQNFEVDIYECNIEYSYSGGYYEQDSDGTQGCFFEPKLDDVMADEANVNIFLQNGEYLRFFDSEQEFNEFCAAKACV